MQTLNFIIEGQTLKKGKNFPEIVEKSKDFLVLSVENIPSGYEAAAFFSLSWENDTVYNQVIANGECIIPEYCTTLPEIVSDYVDYKLGISIAGVNGAGKRFTTNVVEVVLDKTLYRSETTNTPEIPDSQFDEMLENVANIVEPLKKVENVEKFNPRFVNDNVVLIVPAVDYLYGGKPSQSQFHGNILATETTSGVKYISVKNYSWGGTSTPDYGVIGDTLNPEGYTSVASVECVGGVWLPESFEMLPIDVAGAVDILREEMAESGVGDKAFVSWEDLASSDKKIKLVAGIIRNSGSGWDFIENTTHSKLNLSSVTEDTTSIKVNFDFTAKKILGFSAIPDETFSGNGIKCGTSVGTTSVIIKLHKEVMPFGGYIYYDGSNWNISKSNGITSATFSNGILTLKHANIGTGNQYFASVEGRDGALCSLGSVGADNLQVKFYDYSGSLKTTEDTSMKFYLTRENRPQTLVPSNVVDANGNIWLMGIFEI